MERADGDLILARIGEDASICACASALSAIAMAVWAKPSDQRGGSAVRPVRSRNFRVTSATPGPGKT